MRRTIEHPLTIPVYPEAMRPRRFFVYILASHSRVLYTGVTRDLLRRVFQHRQGIVSGFTRRYRITRLVYFEETPCARSAFARERQIKNWTRKKRIHLIESTNAGWIDLAEDWLPKSKG